MNVQIISHTKTLKQQIDFYELEVPFEDKDIAKSAKCWFNPESKNWCIDVENEKYDEMVKLYSRVHLYNIFENKEIYKANKAKWNFKKCYWTTYSSNDALKDYFTT